MGDGGAIFVEESTLDIRNSAFFDNIADHDGGAIYALNSTVLIENFDPFMSGGFFGNYASDNGGAIYANNSTIDIFGTPFIENSADYEGGAIYALGSDVTIGVTTFEDNGFEDIGSVFLGNETRYVNDVEYSFGGGGAIFMAPLLSTDPATRVEGEDEFYNAYYIDYWTVDLGSLDIRGTVFNDNSTDGEGGAIALRGTNATLLETSFFDNSAGNNGGAIYFNDFNFDSAVTTDGNNYLLSVTPSEVRSTLDIRVSEFSSNVAADEGGAIYVEESTVYIKDSTFGRLPSMVEDDALDDYVLYYGNSAGDQGGAIYINESTVDILNSNFYNNSAGDEGGAIYIENSVVFIVGSIFGRTPSLLGEDDLGYDVFLSYGNSAGDQGGAIYVYNSTVEILQSNFSNNSAGDEGGAIYIEESTVDILNSTFEGNHSDTEGGAIYIYHGTVDILDSNFYNNSADYGGAIYVYEDGGGTFVSITNAIFEGNSADFEGGAIDIEGSVVSILNSDFILNSAEVGGAISSDSSSLYITESTFRDNSALNGGAIDASESSVYIYSSLFEFNEAFANQIFENGVVVSREGGLGGAISVLDGPLYVTDSVFLENSADYSGGAIYGLFSSGGEDHVVSVYQSIFEGNQVTGEDFDGYAIEGSPLGGAIHVQVAPMADNTGTAVEIWGSIFDENLAFDGAAVVVENAEYVEIFGSIFDSNTAFGEVDLNPLDGDYVTGSAVLLNNVDEVFIHFSDFRYGGALTLGNVDFSNIIASTFTANSSNFGIIQIADDEAVFEEVLDDEGAYVGPGQLLSGSGYHSLSYNTFVNNLEPSIVASGFVDLYLLANVFADEYHDYGHVYFYGPGEDFIGEDFNLESHFNYTTAAESLYATPVTWGELDLELEVGARNNTTAGFGEYERDLELLGWRPSLTSVLANVVPSFELGDFIEDGFPIIPTFDFFGAPRENTVGGSGLETVGALRAGVPTPPNPGGGGGYTPPPLPPLSHIVIPPAAAASQTLFLVNGNTINGTTSVVNGAIRLAWDSYQVNITPTLTAGSLSAIAADGVLEYVVGDGTTTTVSGSGLLPMSTVHVYILSTPTLLGTFTTDAEGKFTGSLVLPSTMASGKHYLQVNGYSKQSTIASGSVAVRVMRVVENQASSKPITFRVNSSRLTKANKDLLSKMVQDIRSVPGFLQKTKIVVNGSASPEGMARLNSRLAKARANAVVSYLKGLGITPEIIEVTQEDKRSRSAQVQVIYKNKA
jgi:predicted outer membrane repeat protein